MNRFIPILLCLLSFNSWSQIEKDSLSELSKTELISIIQKQSVENAELKSEKLAIEMRSFRELNRLKSLNQTQKMTMSQYLLRIFELEEIVYQLELKLQEFETDYFEKSKGKNTIDLNIPKDTIQGK